MLRNPDDLDDKNVDILVIGAGIFGVCVAWSAVQRGLTVAIVDKADFGGATSSNHYKFIHSGIRYLQHADIPLLRQSSTEKSALFKIAPHLTYPMPIVLPTYGHGRRGKALMRAGMLAYDLLTLDQNLGIRDPARKTPWGTTLSRNKVENLFPELARKGLTGAALFYDGQIYNAPRLVLSFLSAAIEKGAVAVNYMAAKKLVRDKDRITGCFLKDQKTGRNFEIRCQMVVNATGPWSSYFMADAMNSDLQPKPSFSRDLAFVVDKSICSTHALGCQAVSSDSDALLDRGGRHLFLVPWRGKTLIGVWHGHSEAHPDKLPVSNKELEQYLSEINSSYPGLELGLEDIKLINTGHILFGSESKQSSANDHSFAKHSMLIDHADQDVEGLISLVGARATVARGMGEKTIDLIEKKLNRKSANVTRHLEPIYGGHFEKFDNLIDEVKRHLNSSDYELAKAIAHNYGSEFKRVTECAPMPSFLTPIGSTNVLKAEILHALRHEMALDLADVVFRRTELCTGGHPGNDAIEIAAEIAAQEIGWTDSQREAEISKVYGLLENWGPWHISN